MRQEATHPFVSRWQNAGSVRTGLECTFFRLCDGAKFPPLQERWVKAQQAEGARVGSRSRAAVLVVALNARKPGNG